MIREAVLAKIEKAGGIDSYIRSRRYNFCVCRLDHGSQPGAKYVVISKHEVYQSFALLCKQCKRIHKDDKET